MAPYVTVRCEKCGANIAKPPLDYQDDPDPEDSVVTICHHLFHRRCVVDILSTRDSLCTAHSCDAVIKTNELWRVKLLKGQVMMVNEEIEALEQRVRVCEEQLSGTMLDMEVQRERYLSLQRAYNDAIKNQSSSSSNDTVRESSVIQGLREENARLEADIARRIGEAGDLNDQLQEVLAVHQAATEALQETEDRILDAYRETHRLQHRVRELTIDNERLRHKYEPGTAIRQPPPGLLNLKRAAAEMAVTPTTPTTEGNVGITNQLQMLEEERNLRLALQISAQDYAQTNPQPGCSSWPVYGASANSDLPVNMSSATLGPPADVLNQLLEPANRPVPITFEITGSFNAVRSVDAATMGTTVTLCSDRSTQDTDPSQTPAINTTSRATVTETETPKQVLGELCFEDEISTTTSTTVTTTGSLSSSPAIGSTLTSRPRSLNLDLSLPSSLPEPSNGIPITTSSYIIIPFATSSPAVTPTTTLISGTVPVTRLIVGLTHRSLSVPSTTTATTSAGTNTTTTTVYVRPQATHAELAAMPPPPFLGIGNFHRSTLHHTLRQQQVDENNGPPRRYGNHRLPANRGVVARDPRMRNLIGEPLSPFMRTWRGFSNSYSFEYAQYYRRYGTRPSDLRPFVPMALFPNGMVIAGHFDRNQILRLVLFAHNTLLMGDGFSYGVAVLVTNNRPYAPDIDMELYRYDMTIVEFHNLIRSYSQLPYRIVISIGNTDAWNNMEPVRFEQLFGSLILSLYRRGAECISVLPLLVFPGMDRFREGINNVLRRDWVRLLENVAPRLSYYVLTRQVQVAINADIPQIERGSPRFEPRVFRRMLLEIKNLFDHGRGRDNR